MTIVFIGTISYEVGFKELQLSENQIGKELLLSEHKHQGRKDLPESHGPETMSCTL
jgi:hypothetical protein